MQIFKNIANIRKNAQILTNIIWVIVFCMGIKTVLRRIHKYCKCLQELAKNHKYLQIFVVLSPGVCVCARNLFAGLSFFSLFH